MVFNLNQKVALITGGVSGIGFEFAKALLRNGAKGVTLADINTKLAEKALEDIENEFGKNKAIYVETDVTDIKQFENAFQKTVDRFQNVDILFNNSGIFNDADWNKEIAVNMTGVVHGMVLGLENYLQKYRQGEESVIVNTASITGIGAFGKLPIYAGTKAAVVGMTRSWGVPQHYERTKVRCVAICPGFTVTPIFLNLGFLGEPYKNLNARDGALPTQKAEFVADETMKVIQSGGTGTIWVIEGEQPAYEYISSERKRYIE